ncbi:MAG: hypothetical protein PSX37_05885, partial [bacterium]|nr:hypothetical protein [bacterium]
IYGQATSGSGWEWLFWDDLELLPLGTGYLYDAAGRLAQVVQPDGSVFRLEHDRFGNVSRTVDARGRSTTFQYDGLNRLVKITDPLGNSYGLTYNAAGDLASFKEPGLTSPTLYDYDDVGRLWKITYPDSSTEIFTYKDNGDLLTYTDTSARVFTFAYNTADRLWKITNPGSQTVEFTYGAAGFVATRQERNGDLTTFTRNDLYQVTSEVMAPGSGSSTLPWGHEHTFDAAGNRLSLSAGSGGGGSVYGTGTYGNGTYGAAASPVWTVPTGLTGYDAMNRLKRFTDQGSQNTDFAYDAEGRRTSITHPNGAATQAVYDFLGRLLSLTTTRSGSTLLALTYGYDPNGNRVRQVADSTTFDYHLDDADRLVGESIDCWSVRTAADLRRGAASGTDTVSIPGKLGLLKWDDTFTGSVLNADRWRPVISETELIGFRIRQQDGLHLVFPEGYTTRTFAQAPPIVNNYGVSQSAVWCGLEHRRLLNGDFTVQVEFDKLQQVTAQISVPYGSGYGRVRIGLLVDSQPTELRGGALAAMYRTVDPDPSGGLGDVWESQIQTGTPPATVATAAAAGATAGWLRIQRVSGQLSTWYSANGTTWTQVGATTAFSGNGLRVALLLEATYAPAAVRFKSFEETDQADYPASGTYESEVYDSGQDNAAWGTLTWTENLPSGTDVTVDVAVQNTTPFGAWSYSGGYTNPAGSSLSGLTGRYLRYRVTMTGGSATPEASGLRLTFGSDWQDRAYGFDGRGNMTSKEVVSASGTVSEARSFNNLNQITQNVIGSATWLYNWVDGAGKNSGSLLQKKKSDDSEIWDYTWSDDNRLTRVVKTVSSVVTLDVAHTYDSLGRMLTRKLSTDANPTRFEWDGWDLVREVDPAGVETVYYAPQGEITSFKRGSSVYQVHADALGSVRKVTDTTGANVANYDFDAWGSLIDSSGTLASAVTRRFVGAFGCRFDSDAEILYMRLRWYDPTLGRFISRDPASFLGQSYLYARNSPQAFIDPLGDKWRSIEEWRKFIKERGRELDPQGFKARQHQVNQAVTEARQRLKNIGRATDPKQILGTFYAPDFESIFPTPEEYTRQGMFQRGYMGFWSDLCRGSGDEFPIPYKNLGVIL